MSPTRPASGPRHVVVPLFPERGGRGVPSSPAIGESGHTLGRPARVAHMLALAIRIEKMIASGELSDRAHAAANLGVSRARMTQILSLTLLAPDIQEELLFLETDDGVERITERSLRTVVRFDDWEEQRRQWRELLECVGLCRALQ